MIAAIYAPYVEHTVVSFETVPPDAATLLRHADAAMYRAKTAGKATYVMASSLGEASTSSCTTG